MKFSEISRFLIEKLSEREKANIERKKPSHHPYIPWKPLFEGEVDGRKIIPLESDEAEAELPADKEIMDALGEAGYFITDYRDGKCKKIDKSDNRIFRIGSILAKLKRGDLIRKFQERLSEKGKGGKSNTAKSSSGYQLVLTRNPYDIAGMSTDKAWKSCMNIRDGAHCDTPMMEIANGGCVAYLINTRYDPLMKKDAEEWLDHSAARIAIKRVIQYEAKIDDEGISWGFVMEDVTYGDVQLAERLNFDGVLGSLINEANDKTMDFSKKHVFASIESYSDSFDTQEVFKTDRISYMIKANTFSLAELDKMYRGVVMGEKNLGYSREMGNQLSPLMIHILRAVIGQARSNLDQVKKVIRIWMAIDGQKAMTDKISNSKFPLGVVARRYKKPSEMFEYLFDIGFPKPASTVFYLYFERLLLKDPEMIDFIFANARNAEMAIDDSNLCMTELLSAPIAHEKLEPMIVKYGKGLMQWTRIVKNGAGKPYTFLNKLIMFGGYYSVIEKLIPEFVDYFKKNPIELYGLRENLAHRLGYMDAYKKGFDETHEVLNKLLIALGKEPLQGYVSKG